MSAKYWQKGEAIDYTAAAKIAAGDVVNLATRIGVAAADIAAGETGAVHVTGVCELPKATGALTLGQAPFSGTVAEDNSTAAGTEPANIPAGWAVAAAESADTTVLVKLLG